jgi:hypothetical protein
MTDRALDWKRPNPPRLNDTEALVRKGTYAYTYLASGNKMPNMLEMPYTAEACCKNGAHTRFSRKTGPNEEGLGVACKQIPSSC